MEEKAPSVPQVFVVPSGQQLRTQEAPNEHTQVDPKILAAKASGGGPPGGRTLARGVPGAKVHLVTRGEFTELTPRA